MPAVSILEMGESLSQELSLLLARVLCKISLGFVQPVQ